MNIEKVLNRYLTEENLTAKEIYKNHRYDLFDELLEKDKTGEWICHAGYFWKEFDYEKGFEKLLEKDKTGQWIFNAGNNWKEFDYEKGFDELLEIDKEGQWIYYSGLNWKEFNHNKAFNFINDHFWKKQTKIHWSPFNEMESNGQLLLNFN